jgi:hypothetical protein
MSRLQRHIKSQSTINYEEPYAIIERPTNATFIPKETVETNEEKEGVRQTSETLYAQPGLAQNKKAEGQTETTCFVKSMESKTVGFFA